VKALLDRISETTNYPAPTSIFLSAVSSPSASATEEPLDPAIYTSDEALISAMTEWNDGIPHDPNYLTPKILNGMRMDLKWQEILSRAEGETDIEPTETLK
jgi:hypothetical protein